MRIFETITGIIVVGGLGMALFVFFRKPLENLKDTVNLMKSGSFGCALLFLPIWLPLWIIDTIFGFNIFDKMDQFNISVKRFDEFAGEYAERFMNIDSYRKHIDQFSELIAFENPVILELACGPGNVTRYLKQKFPGSRIIALDLAPRMIEIARQTVSGVDFRLMDVRNIKSLNVKFDAVMCSFCLPFLSKSDAEKLISDCSVVLNKNGVLYISTMEGDESRAGFESTSFTGDSKIYFNYHMQHDLEKALADHGFNVEYLVRQNYIEPNGTILIDIILVAKKI